MKITYGFDAGIAGVFFMIPGLSYILTAIVAGALVDTFGGASTPHQEHRLKVTAAFGYMLFVLCFLFLAPVFARSALEKLVLFTPSLIALGVGFGLSVIPSFSDLGGIAERGMLPSGAGEEAALASQISGVWSSAYQLGQAVGPVMGGVLESTIGTNWGSFTFALLCACGAILNGYGAWHATRAPSTVHPAMQ
jgi:MFS family permease